MSFIDLIGIFKSMMIKLKQLMFYYLNLQIFIQWAKKLKILRIIQARTLIILNKLIEFNLKKYIQSISLPIIGFQM